MKQLIFWKKKKKKLLNITAAGAAPHPRRMAFSTRLLPLWAGKWICRQMLWRSEIRCSTYTCTHTHTHTQSWMEECQRETGGGGGPSQTNYTLRLLMDTISAQCSKNLQVQLYLKMNE